MDSSLPIEEHFEEVPRGEGYGMGGMYPANDPGLTKWQLEQSDVLAEIEAYLKGLVYNPNANDGNGGWVKDHASVLTDDGVKDLVFNLRMHLNKSIILSNLDVKDVNRIARECRKMLIDFVFHNHKRYKIDPNMYTPLVYSIDHQIYAVLKRAYFEGERKFLSKSERRSEVHVREPTRTGGVFGKLFK